VNQSSQSGEPGEALPEGTVLDGEVIAGEPERSAPASFASLQRRGSQERGRQPAPSMPMAFVAYDLLESGGVTSAPSAAAALARLRGAAGRVDQGIIPKRQRLRISAGLSRSAEELEVQRGPRRRGWGRRLMLPKRLDSLTGAGRRRGDWWKHKNSNRSIRLPCVLYAQGAVGRTRQPLHRLPLWPLEPAAWNHWLWRCRKRWPGEPEAPAVDLARLYSALMDAEINETRPLDPRHTTEAFRASAGGAPCRCFELAFEEKKTFGCSPRNATRAASPLRFRASPAGAATKRRRKPIAWQAAWR